MDIQPDDLSGSDIICLLEEHVRDAQRWSPPESVHALDLTRLRQSDITFWTAREQGILMGCCALRELDRVHGEIKSMRTAPEFLRRGVAAALLEHLIAESVRRGYQRLSLETGSMDAFAPARAMYARFGFEPCPPFADYVLDRHSVCMTRLLPAFVSPS